MSKMRRAADMVDDWKAIPKSEWRQYVDNSDVNNFSRMFERSDDDSILIEYKNGECLLVGVDGDIYDFDDIDEAEIYLGFDFNYL